MTKNTETFERDITKDQLNDLMNRRHSLFPRQFNGEQIQNDSIVQILELANTAPSHKRTYPWRFTVHTGETLMQLMDFLKQRYLEITPAENVQEKKIQAFEERKHSVSHVIAISMKRDPQKRIPEWEEIAAVSCAVQNIYLALHTYGISGYWSTGNVVNDVEVKKFYELEEEDRFMGFFYMGIVDEHIVFPKREPATSKITWRK